MEGDAPPRKRAPLPVQRVEALIDGTFVVAMTLLTLGLAVPVIAPEEVHATLGARLGAMGPNFLAYALAFLGMVAYWTMIVAHGRYLVRYDQTLVGIVTWLLLSIVLIPFSTAVMGTYPDETLSVLIFVANNAVAFVFAIAHWEYLARHPELTTEPISPRFRRVVSLRTAVPLVLFALAAVGAIWMPRLAVGVAFAVAFVWTAPGLAKLVWYRRSRRW